MTPLQLLGGIATSILAAGGILFFAGCASPAYVAAPGGPYYDYYYYPGPDIYYYPSGHIYYWNDGGHWRSGARLPRSYSLHREYHERLRLHSREPWAEHREARGERREDHGRR